MGNVPKPSWRFNEDFIKGYNEKSDKGHFLEVDDQYTKNYMNFIIIHQKRWKLNKIEKLVADGYHKAEYVINIRNLKQVSNHGLVL